MKKIAAAVLVGALALSACGDDDTSDPPGTTGDTGATGATSTTSGSTGPGLASGFGTDGVATVALSTSGADRFMATAIGADGKVYAAGFVNEGGDQAFALARIDATTGKLDSSFGTSGVATVNVAVGGKTAELARGIRVQADGKIVIAGPAEADPKAAGDAAKDTNVAVARFDATGKLDTSYGDDGVAILDFGTGRATSATAFGGDTSWGIAGGPGERTYVFGSKLASEADRVDADYVVAAVTNTGTLDSAFGTDGMLTVDAKSNGGDSPRGIIVQPDGKIVTAGYTRDGDGIVTPTLLRITSAGALDTSFGTGGIASADILKGVTEAYAVALQGDSYVAAGYGRGPSSDEKVDHIVYRFTADGEWDKSFGTDGVTRLDIAEEDDRARNVAVLDDGRILTTGSGKTTAADIDGMAVMLSEDGAPVSEFGTDGHELMDLGGPSDSLFGISLSPDGSFAILAGYKGVEADSGANDDAVVVRIDV